MSIGFRIKEARKAAGFTQATLAEKIGATKGAIANYENGVSVPKVELLYRLMKELDVDANYLYQDDMGNAGSNKIVAPEQIESDIDEIFDSLEKQYGPIPKDKFDLIVRLAKAVLDNDI